jgi:hypothetical protein
VLPVDPRRGLPLGSVHLVQIAVLRLLCALHDLKSRHQDFQEILLILPNQVMRGCTVAEIDNEMHCIVLNLVHRNSPSLGQIHQASCTLLPLFSVLHSFTKQLSVNLLCTLLISSTPYGASLDLFHSVARGEGGILSKDTAVSPWTLQLHHLSLRQCCCLYLLSKRQYCCLINKRLIHLGLNR